jgi:hypothetical protein
LKSKQTKTQNMPNAFQKSIIGTTQTKALGVLALAALALSFAVGLKTSSTGVAFIGFAVGALVLLLTLYDVNCLVVGGCSVWAWLRAILIGLTLVAMIWVQIMVLSGSAKPAIPLVSN